MTFVALSLKVILMIGESLPTAKLDLILVYFKWCLGYSASFSNAVNSHW